MFKTLLLVAVVIGAGMLTLPFLSEEKNEHRNGVYIISHFPRKGAPWTIEKWWREEEVWIPFVSYNSREAAEDAKRQFETKRIKIREVIP